MTMRVRAIALGWLLIVATSAGVAHAQPTAAEGRFRLAGTAGVAKLFRIEDRSFGTTVNLGGEAGLRVFRRGWIVFEANRFVGLETDPAPCGLVDVTCTGGGRTGYDSATVGSMNLTYHFGDERVHVVVSGGFGFIRASGFATTTFADGSQVEREVNDQGWGPTAAVGFVVPFARGWSVDPTLRIYGADRPNLAAFRATLAMTRTW